MKLFFNKLNDWVNPFSENYQNAIKDFDKCQGLEKVITVAASIFCGLAFIVGGFAAFRGIVSWLHPGKNSKADKVNETIKSMHNFSPPHPAEQPTETDLISKLPNEILLLVVGYLDKKSLGNIGGTSKLLFSASKEAWEGFVKNRIGSTVADILKKNRDSWRDVMVDLNRPFEKLSNAMSTLGILDENWKDNAELEIVCDHIKENDTIGLTEALCNIKKTNKLYKLNSRCLGNSPLELTAMLGNVDHARLLIEYGAKDALSGGHYRSKDGVKGLSALFYAAENGHVEMVKFLLENGARPNLNLESDGYNHPLISILIMKIPGESVNILECLLFLINAWKVEVGHKIVCQHDDAKMAFELAIRNGYANVANLLFGLGIRIDLYEGREDIVYRAIIQKNLEMIKFFHVRGLIDLKNLKRKSGETLLHTAFSLNANEILQYLIDEVKIPTDVVNFKKETYDVSGKKELEQNIRRAIAENIKLFGGSIHIRLAPYKEPFEECLKHNVDLNVPIDDKGQTILHLAAMQILHFHLNGENGIINSLLENGANPHIEDYKGLTPLQSALDVISKAKEDEVNFRFVKKNLSNVESLIKKMQKIKNDKR